MPPDSPNSGVDNWLRDPRQAFDTWLAAQRFRPSSILVYRAQWHHFLDWLAAQGRSLKTAEPALIDEFAATIDVKRQQRARYLRIMERVFDDMNGSANAIGNPARAVTSRTDAAWADSASNAPTGFLRDDERMQLWSTLALAHQANGMPLPWRDLRDRALAAVLLGCGLKLHEASALTLAALIPAKPGQAGAIRVAANSANARHTTLATTTGSKAASAATTAAPASTPSSAEGMITPDGTRTIPVGETLAPILSRWLGARAEEDIAGDLVFPAGRGGLQMHKATALRAIDTLVDVSGLSPGRVGRISPQTLRNAYAAELLADGADDTVIAERLGFAKILSARRLRAAWDLWFAHPLATSEAEGPISTRPARHDDRQQPGRPR